MRSILFFGLIFAFFTLIGCKTTEPVPETVPEPLPVPAVEEPIAVKEVWTPTVTYDETMVPLTPAILQRLRDSGEEMNINERIKRYQFRLAGKITMEREFVETNDGISDEGTARFENKYIRENIIIGDRTDGQAMELRTLLNETTISLCFENDDKYQLVFVAEKNNPDGYFYLYHIPAFNGGEEKGTLTYGDVIYKIKFDGMAPYILIKLFRKDSDFVNSRTVTGRQVW